MRKSCRFTYVGILICVISSVEGVGLGIDEEYEYRLLATNKTSTMEKEMGEAGGAGFKFAGVMGGETSFGGSEVVVVMQRIPTIEEARQYQYKLLATSKTSTMQKELQQASDEGFEYCGQTVFKTSFSGSEVVVILERDRDKEPAGYDEYKLLGTKKTSTMEKELRKAGAAGYRLVGLTVSKTRFGGAELVTILQRRVQKE